MGLKPNIELTHALRQEFGPEATRDTTDPHSHGPAAYEEIKGLKVNSILSGPFTRILPLRASPQGYPLDLLTGEGAVICAVPACVRSMPPHRKSGD